jgi:peptidoglycan/LPS O-acetylase OafA/YrhL
MEINDKTRNIPSLDGMRAISILLVIGAHSAPSSSYLIFAHTGVSVFFVISGFLITSLLLKELHATGTIKLKRFYVRRAFRIFPAFYVYLGIIFALALFGVFQTPLLAFLFAAIYTSNYYLGPGGGFLGLQHIWSLCVEEQFYLLWPAALLMMGRRRAGYLAGFLIIASPLSRVVTYAVLAPPHRAAVDRMFHSSIDTIMFGCLLALLWQNDRFNRLLRAWITPWSMAGAICFLFLLDPLLVLRFRGSYSLVFGMTLEGISICLITLYGVTRVYTLPGRMLNAPILRHIGVISYSLYLWQNIFTGEAGRYFPLNLVATAVCAELSYWAVERPALRLRDRFW